MIIRKPAYGSKKSIRNGFFQISNFFFLPPAAELKRGVPWTRGSLERIWSVQTEARFSEALDSI